MILSSEKSTRKQEMYLRLNFYTLFGILLVISYYVVTH